MIGVRILLGDVLDRLAELPDESVHCVVTSPPYWGMRDYGVMGQLGLEPTIEEYIGKMAHVFEEVRRVLRSDGTLWLNMGDSYTSGGRGGGDANCKQRTNVGSLDAPPNNRVAGLRSKNLVGQPWRLAFALQAAGWYLRSDIIWAKPNPVPESVTDRPTKAHEYIFLMAKRASYYFDQEAVKERSVSAGMRASGGKKWSQTALTPAGGRQHLDALGQRTVAPCRNVRSVWTISPQPFLEAHFATFPEELPRRCIATGTSEKGCCPDCAAPWVRVADMWQEKIGNSAFGNERPDANRGEHRKDVPQERTRKHTTARGWNPGCECGKEPVPALVMDPFGGAGTTGLVAARMGRDAILIELLPKYVEMAHRRIERECGILAHVGSE